MDIGEIIGIIIALIVLAGIGAIIVFIATRYKRKLKERSCEKCGARVLAERIEDVQVVSESGPFLKLAVSIKCQQCGSLETKIISVRNNVGESRSLKYVAAKYFEALHRN